PPRQSPAGRLLQRLRFAVEPGLGTVGAGLPAILSGAVPAASIACRLTSCSGFVMAAIRGAHVYHEFTTASHCRSRRFADIGSEVRSFWANRDTWYSSSMKR